MLISWDWTPAWNWPQGIVCGLIVGAVAFAGAISGSGKRAKREAAYTKAKEQS